MKINAIIAHYEAINCIIPTSTLRYVGTPRNVIQNRTTGDDYSVQRTSKQAPHVTVHEGRDLHAH